jgi:WD40 repeat protein
MYARSGVEQAPLQTYVLAALFAPSKSVIRKIVGKTAFIDCVRRSPNMPERWDAMLLVLEAHSGKVAAVQFSADGSQLASASDGGEVIVWDPTTGAQQHILEGHSDMATAVQFSLDGSKLASASQDGMIIIWDPTTGAQQHILEGHLDVVTAVQFSADGTKLLSASQDGIIVTWDATTGAQQHILEAHPDVITAVQFSADGSKLASASQDGMITIWDATTGAQQHILEAHSDAVTTVQFSADGTKLASASDDQNIIVWDLKTELPIQLIGNRVYVLDLAFSGDGLYLIANVGGFKLSFPIEVSCSEDVYPLDLRHDYPWISRHGHKVIWLPPTLRPVGVATAVYRAIMVFGHFNGGVSFWEFGV